MNLLLFEEENLVEPSIAQVTGSRADHLRSVLKVTLGQQLRVGLINGGVGCGEVVEISEEHVLVNICKLEDCSDTSRRTELLLAMPRPQILKRVLETTATMGVKKLTLVGSQRVEKSYFQSPLLQEANYHQYLLKGLEQGMVTALPTVEVCRHLSEVSLKEEALRLVADPSSSEMINQITPISQMHFQLAIGPEGGWVKSELEYFQNNGFIPFSLSKNILRVDTALSVALGQIELLCDGKK